MHVPPALMRFARPSLGRSLGLFYAALLLLAAANGLIVANGLGRLERAAAAANAAADLRWLATAVRLGTLKAATNRGGDRRSLEADLDRFEHVLVGLEAGRGPDLQAMIGALRVEWARLRQEALAAFAGPPAEWEAGRVPGPAEQAGVRVGERVDLVVAAVNSRSREAEEEVRSGLALLALLDAALILVGFFSLRFNLVGPLRRLAAASRSFVSGKSARTPFQDEIGELVQAFDQMAEQIEVDVRQIRLAHQDLRKLSRAVEQSPATVIITDPQGIIEYVNPKFTEVTGYPRQEAVGRKMNLIRSGVTPPEVYRDLWDTILSGREWSGELLNRKQSGELFWDATRIAPLKDEDGRITHFVTVKEDITEKKRAQEEIAYLNAELERLVEERTRQLSTINKELVAFSYSVAHDLQAPLRGINGFANLMATETCRNCDNPEAVECQQRIQRASRRMGDLIDDLLELSRVARSEVKAETTDLSGMARSILDDLAAADPQRKVATHVQDGIVVKGDPALLHILLENLLANAWKFTSKQPEATIVVGSERKDGEQRVFVRDNGAGFDMRYADKLFTAFQRLHGPREFEGSGIGLATVQRVVTLHGGRVWADAEVGRGAVFYFALPEPREAVAG